MLSSAYYYDDEIEMYYLQSRYYDPVLRRFINGDESVVFATNRRREYVLFAYCENEPVNKADLFGFVSYKNTKTKKQEGIYDITSVISGWRKTLTYNYKISNGIIQFPFESNDYWGVLWRGWAKTLATAMYRVAKGISCSYLIGRTITGLHVELLVHWALFKVGIKVASTKQADMGSRWGIGYDSNAWVFETAHIIARFANMNINWLWAYIWQLRDIARYF